MKNYDPNKGMPAQKLPNSKKGKSWGEACVNAISGMSSGRSTNGRSSHERKKSNYDLVNSIVNEKDYKYVLDPFDQGDSDLGVQPARLRDINLVTNKVKLLQGEELQRPFNFQVIATNGEAVSEKEVMKRDLLTQSVYQRLAQETGKSLEPQIDPNTGEEIPVTFAGVDKYMSYSYKDLREKWGNEILQYLKHKENLSLKFNEGWEHALIAAEEIYYVGIVNGEPKLRICNPVNCEYDRNPDNPNIEDGDWFRERRNMTLGQIIDEFGEFLSESQINKLDRGEYSRSLKNSTHPLIGYRKEDLDNYESSDNDNHYKVDYVVWKSMKKIGFLSFPEEEDETIVDENFKLTPEMKEEGYSLEWTWIPEVWGGVQIAKDLYVNIAPLPNQARSMDNPREVKLPYVGRVYNATNSVQTSLVELMKPHQYLYNIVWFRLECEIAKSDGRKFVFDMAQLPKSEGFDMEKWMYYFKNVGIAFVNSAEEGKDGSPSNHTFNQFQSVDMAMSQSVSQYIGILDKIEALIDKIVGITPQREGQTKATETATGIQNSMTQSSMITESFFYMHNEVKKKVLSSLLECAKFAYPSSKKLNYITDDLTRVMLNLDMDKFADSDYGVFVTNSNRDNIILNKIQGLADAAVQSGMAQLSDAAKIYRAESVVEITKELEELEKEKSDREQQQAEQQERIVQQQIEAQQMEKEAERQFEAEQNQLDRDADLHKTVISTMGFDTDTHDNDVIDVVEQGKQALEQMKMSNDQMDKDKQRSHEQSEKEKDRQLKRDELKSKESIEKLKAKTALKNKVTGEK